MDNLFSLLIIYAVGVMVLLYVTTILPGKKKNKKVREMHASIQVGDTIATIGDIIGKVVERDEETIKLLICEKTGAEMKIVVMAAQTILEKADGSKI